MSETRPLQYRFMFEFGSQTTYPLYNSCSSKNPAELEEGQECIPGIFYSEGYYWGTSFPWDVEP